MSVSLTRQATQRLIPQRQMPSFSGAKKTAQDEVHFGQKLFHPKGPKLLSRLLLLVPVALSVVACTTAKLTKECNEIEKTQPHCTELVEDALHSEDTEARQWAIRQFADLDVPYQTKLTVMLDAMDDGMTNAAIFLASALTQDEAVPPEVRKTIDFYLESRPRQVSYTEYEYRYGYCPNGDFDFCFGPVTKYKDEGNAEDFRDAARQLRQYAAETDG